MLRRQAVVFVCIFRSRAPSSIFRDVFQLIRGASHLVGMPPDESSFWLARFFPIYHIYSGIVALPFITSVTSSFVPLAWFLVLGPSYSLMAAGTAFLMPQVPCEDKPVTQAPRFGTTKQRKLSKTNPTCPRFVCASSLYLPRTHSFHNGWMVAAKRVLSTALTVLLAVDLFPPFQERHEDNPEMTTHTFTAVPQSGGGELSCSLCERPATRRSGARPRIVYSFRRRYPISHFV